MISPVRPHAVTAIVMTAPKWRAASAQYRFDHRDESQMSIIGEGKPHGKRKHTTKRDRFDGYGRSGFDDGSF